MENANVVETVGDFDFPGRMSCRQVAFLLFTTAANMQIAIDADFMQMPSTSATKS